MKVRICANVYLYVCECMYMNMICVFLSECTLMCSCVYVYMIICDYL